MPKQLEILCTEVSLYNAWNIVKEKGAAGGIDGITIQLFEKEKHKQIPLLANIQYSSMCKKLSKIVVRREDWVNIYPLCSECFARIEYIPPVKKKEPVKIAVI